MGQIKLPKKIDLKLNLRNVQKTACELSLSAFIKRAWHIIEPAQLYVHGWHIDFLCAHLEAITEGKVLDNGEIYNRLLINIPPGPGWVENLVMTDKGRVRLGDIKPGDMVLTHKGRFRNVSACYSKGRLDTLVVKTRSGREMVLTPDHNVLTPDGWVEARHLVIGSTLAVVTPETGLANEFVSPEEARLLGYLIGDGSITQATVSFTNHDADTIEDFEHCAAIVGFATKRGDRGVVRVHGGAKVHDWLESHGLFRASSYDKHIPASILNSNNRIIQNFIGAYWSCDGMFDVRPTKARGSSYRASATTVSKRLADDLLHALTRIGIRSVLRPKARKLDTAAQPGGVYRSYNIEVYAEEDTARFIDMPGLSARKNALAHMCAKRRFDSVLMEDPVVEILPGGERECMCISVDEDHSLTWSDIAVHNTMKSLCTSVFWPAWEWGPKNMPNLRYVCVSHSQDLAIRDNIRMRRLVESDWYQDLWPHVQMVSDQNAKTKFETTATGFRQAVAAGSITGARGDRVIIDDPLSVEDAASEQIRKTREDWFLESVPSRLNNPISSAIIVIMQRLHESDTSGLILDRQLGYDHICLPMRFVAWRKEFPTKLGYVDPREVEGELLFPDRFPQSVVDRDERIMGIYATAGQNQQEPVPRGGGIIERDWWRVYQSEDNAYPAFDYIVAALDTAYGEKQHEGDFSALTVWGVFTSDLTAQVTKTVGANGMMTVERSYSDQQTPKVMLIYAYNKRAPFHQLLQDTADICTKFQVDRVLVEGKASGLSILQELRRVYGHEPWAIEAVNPEVDKIARLYSVSSLFSDGLVYASTKEWAEQVILQTCNFPKSKNDDLVDTVSMALRHLRKIGILQRSAERVAELESMKQYTGGAPAPLYAV